jgi:hypothetical protein
MNRKIALILFTLIVWLVPVRSETIQGGIDHSEYLPAMPQQMQPGSAYYGAQGQPATVIWYPIPNWLAGTFQSDFITNQVTQVYSPAAPKHRASGRVKHVETYGALPDASGQIWHADILPHVGLWEGAQEEVQTTVEKSCVQTNNDKVILHIHNHAVYLSPDRRQVVYSDQVDGFKNITLAPPGNQLAIYDDIQEYDSMGRPLDRYIATSQMQKIADFAPKDSDNGVDLHASLAQYLTSIGHPELIPGTPNTQSQ